jgi:glycogen(starch) synthase
MTQNFDIIYCERSGDIVDSFNKWSSKDSNRASPLVTYSSQFFEFSKRIGATTYALSGCSRSDWSSASGFLVKHHRRRSFRIPVVGYHLEQLRYGLLLFWLACRYRPKVMYVDSGVTNWIFLAPIRLLRIRIVAVLHNTLWPDGFRPSGLGKRLILATAKPFFRFFADASFCLSPAVERQVRCLVGKRPHRVVNYRALFDPRHFVADPRHPSYDDRPFRVMFAGRIEQEKGVFDLLESASQLQLEHPGDYLFHICGDGIGLKPLNERIAELGLSAVVITHGRLDREALIDKYRKAHVVVVPTRSNFCEGYAQVVAEAVLLGRPVITNRVVPAFEDLHDAIEEAIADDPKSLTRCIKRLSNDKDLFEAKRRACAGLRDRILDETTSFFWQLLNNRDIVKSD